MAGFLNLHSSEYAAKYVANRNAAMGVADYNAPKKNGEDPFASTLVTIFPQLFMGFTEKIAEKSDGKGGASETSDDSELKTLKRQFKQVLNKIGAKDETQINESVADAQNKSQTKINTAQAEVDSFNNGTDKYSTQIATLQSQLVTGEDLTDEQKANNDKINKKIESLNKDRTKAQEKAQKNLEQTVKTETANIQEIKANAEEAYKIFEKISGLVDVDNKDNNYVREKNEVLHDLNNQRTVFLTSTNPTDKKAAAQKIKQIAEENPNDINIQTTYKLLKNRIETCLK